MDFIRSLHHTFTALPYVGAIKPVVFYLTIFFASLIESIPLIGTFTPGALILITFGFLTTHQAVSLPGVVIVAAFAAVIGDAISYCIGFFAWKKLSKVKWIMKYGKLDSGHAFLEKHGGKSVLFSRFIGPIRPVVPLLAGAVKMPLRKFLSWNILGALLWAGTYICMGFFFGAHFRRFSIWLSRAGVLGFIVLLLIIVIYGFKEKKTQEIIDEMKDEEKDLPTHVEDIQ